MDYFYTDYNRCPVCGEPRGVCQCGDYHDDVEEYEDDEPTEDYIDWLIARFDSDNGGR